MKPHTPEFDERARELEQAVSDAFWEQGAVANTSFDYAYGETPVIDVRCNIYIDCTDISESTYDAIVAGLDKFDASAPGFTIAAQLEDESGYAYWSQEDDGSALRIIMVVSIRDIARIRIDELIDQLDAMQDYIEQLEGVTFF